MPERVDGILAVVHLLFTTGHTAPVGHELMRRDLVERSIDLGRLLHALLPNDAEVMGLLALLLLTDARSGARVDESGQQVLLAKQDRSRWDRREIVALYGLLAPSGRRLWCRLGAISQAIPPIRRRWR